MAIAPRTAAVCAVPCSVVSAQEGKERGWNAGASNRPSTYAGAESVVVVIRAQDVCIKLISSPLLSSPLTLHASMHRHNVALLRLSCSLLHWRSHFGVLCISAGYVALLFLSLHSPGRAWCYGRILFCRDQKTLSLGTEADAGRATRNGNG